MKVTQSCPTLRDPMCYTVHGILQARILGWLAFPFSRGSSQPRGWTQAYCIAAVSLPAEPQGKPNEYIRGFGFRVFWEMKSGNESIQSSFSSGSTFKWRLYCSLRSIYSQDTHAMEFAKSESSGRIISAPSRSTPGNSFGEAFHEIEGH